jgi:HAD superfamily phosphatase (TIGR01668 family)
MPFSLLPSVIVTSVTEITPAFLKSRGIDLLMLDFDNTIVPYTTNEPTAEMELWIKCMLRVGVKLCVVSNSRKDRVKVFCRKYGLPCITHAKKPFSKGILECLGQFALEPAQCAIAGDQIFTDTLGGN